MYVLRCLHQAIGEHFNELCHHAVFGYAVEEHIRQPEVQRRRWIANEAGYFDAYGQRNGILRSRELTKGTALWDAESNEMQCRQTFCCALWVGVFE